MNVNSHIEKKSFFLASSSKYIQNNAAYNWNVIHSSCTVVIVWRLRMPNWVEVQTAAVKSVKNIRDSIASDWIWNK